MADLHTPMNAHRRDIDLGDGWALRKSVDYYNPEQFGSVYSHERQRLVPKEFSHAHFMMKDGENVGKLTVSSDHYDPAHAHISVETGNPDVAQDPILMITAAGPKHTAGMHVVRRAGRELAKMYPHIKSFGGVRITGGLSKRFSRSDPNSYQSATRDQMMKENLIESFHLKGPIPDEYDPDIHKFEIHDESGHVGNVHVSDAGFRTLGRNGEHFGSTSSSADAARHLDLSVYPLSGQPPLKLGYQGSRNMIQHIAQMYPNAETIGGLRQTGTHSKNDFPFTRVSLGAAHARNSRESFKNYMTLERQDLDEWTTQSATRAQLIREAEEILNDSFDCRLR